MNDFKNLDSGAQQPPVSKELPKEPDFKEASKNAPPEAKGEIKKLEAEYAEKKDKIEGESKKERQGLWAWIKEKLGQAWGFIKGLFGFDDQKNDQKDASLGLLDKDKDADKGLVAKNELSEENEKSKMENALKKLKERSPITGGVVEMPFYDESLKYCLEYKIVVGQSPTFIECRNPVTGIVNRFEGEFDADKLPSAAGFLSPIPLLKSIDFRGGDGLSLMLVASTRFGEESNEDSNQVISMSKLREYFNSLALGKELAIGAGGKLLFKPYGKVQNLYETPADNLTKKMDNRTENIDNKLTFGQALANDLKGIVDVDPKTVDDPINFVLSKLEMLEAGTDKFAKTIGVLKNFLNVIWDFSGGISKLDDALLVLEQGDVQGDQIQKLTQMDSALQNIESQLNAWETNTNFALPPSFANLFRMKLAQRVDRYKAYMSKRYELNSDMNLDSAVGWLKLKAKQVTMQETPVFSAHEKLMNRFVALDKRFAVSLEKAAAKGTENLDPATVKILNQLQEVYSDLEQGKLKVEENFQDAKKDLAKKVIAEKLTELPVVLREPVAEVMAERMI